MSGVPPPSPSSDDPHKVKGPPCQVPMQKHTTVKLDTHQTLVSTQSPMVAAHDSFCTQYVHMCTKYSNQCQTTHYKVGLAQVHPIAISCNPISKL